MEEEFIIPDSLFPTDNDLEIPVLRLDMQATTCDIPFVCYGEQKRTFKMEGNGTLHFYTDDYRFNTVYDHPEKILIHNPRNIVEPNYSLFNETPLAFGLQSIYKKRAIARLLQEVGIRVFVDLNVANKFCAYNLVGVPMGWSSFCTRGYNDRLNALEFEYKLAQHIAGGNPMTFVVYGGGRRVNQWCKSHNAVYVTPVITLKNRLKSIEKMAQNTNTSLFAKGVDLGKTLPSVSGLIKKQIADYNIK